MIFTSDNVDDIRRYYVGSFVKFPREFGDLLFYLSDADPQAVRGKCETGEDLLLWLSNEHPYEVDYVLPRKSYFQHGKTAYQLVRIPAKQYCRGISRDNTMLAVPGGNGKFVPTDLSFDLLRSYVNKQKFFTLDEAIAADGFHSCVLNPRMCYIRETKNIFVDFTKVATVNPKARSIKVNVPLFREEIKQMVAQNTTIFNVGVKVE